MRGLRGTLVAPSDVVPAMTRLHRPLTSCLLPACLLAAFADVASAGGPPPLMLDLLLRAEFETQAVGAPIGTGGAAAGEPVEAYIENSVVEPGIAGQGLQLLDDGISSARSMRFEFLDERELSAGMLYLLVWLRPVVLDTFHVRLREQSSSAFNYGQVQFNKDGSINARDRAGYMGEVAPEDTIEAGSVYLLEWVHDVGAGTHSAYLDGTPLFEDRPHGVPTGPDEPGLGAVLFGYASDPDTDGVYEVDELEVFTDQMLPVEEVFRSGFEVSELID